MYQLLALPELSAEEIDALESCLELELRPRYIDYVRGPKRYDLTGDTRVETPAASERE